MKDMANVKEFYQSPPPGRYFSKVVQAEATVSNRSGATMIHLTLEVRAPQEFAGAQADDYIITDGSAKGASIGRQKLRMLGIDVTSPVEIPDEKIASDLLGTELLVDYGNEARMTESEKGSGNYDKKMTVIDDQTGREVILNKLTVKGYAPHQVKTATPTQRPAPQPQAQFAPPPPQYGQPPQQYAPQSPYPAQQVAQVAPPQYQGAPQGFTPSDAQQATPPWMMNNSQPATPDHPKAEGAKRTRKA